MHSSVFRWVIVYATDMFTCSSSDITYQQHLQRRWHTNACLSVAAAWMGGWSVGLIPHIEGLTIVCSVHSVRLVLQLYCEHLSIDQGNTCVFKKNVHCYSSREFRTLNKNISVSQRYLQCSYSTVYFKNERHHDHFVLLSENARTQQAS